MHIVDALKFIKQGSFAINMDDMKAPTQSNENKNWCYCYFCDKDYCLHLGEGCVISIKDMKSIDSLDDIELKMAKKWLEGTDSDGSHNGQDMNLLGLKCLMFVIRFKWDHSSGLPESSVYLLWDNYQAAYIWYRSLKVMMTNTPFSGLVKREMTKPSTYPLLVSNRLRIGTTTLLDVISNNTYHNTALIRCIDEYLPTMMKDIDKISQFILQFCILDSSCHMSLLAKSKEMSLKLTKIKVLINELEREGEDFEDQKMSDLRELWQCLQADFTICSLKYQQLKSEMGG